MTKLYDGDTFERGGRTFKVEMPYDDSGRVPWEDDDGRGIVSDWTQRDKAPGERILATDHSSKRYFDFAGTIAKAKADGWGLSVEKIAALKATLGRDPKRGEIVNAAVEEEFKFLADWCNDQWQYVGVVVTYIDEDGDEIKGVGRDSIWGVESCADEYITELAHEMADGINAALNRDAATEMEATEFSMTN